MIFFPVPQADEPTYPTVLPARDFDPDKDSARIETAIKTKGKLQNDQFCEKGQKKKTCFCADEKLVFLSQRPGSEHLDHAGKSSKCVCVTAGKALDKPLTKFYPLLDR